MHLQVRHGEGQRGVWVAAELAGGKDHIPETEALGISSFVYK